MWGDMFGAFLLLLIHVEDTVVGRTLLKKLAYVHHVSTVTRQLIRHSIGARIRGVFFSSSDGVLVFSAGCVN